MAEIGFVVNDPRKLEAKKLEPEVLDAVEELEELEDLPFAEPVDVAVTAPRATTRVRKPNQVKPVSSQQTTGGESRNDYIAKRKRLSGGTR